MREIRNEITMRRDNYGIQLWSVRFKAPQCKFVLMPALRQSHTSIAEPEKTLILNCLV